MLRRFIHHGLRIFSRITDARKSKTGLQPLGEVPRVEEIAGVLSGRGLGPGESLRITLSPGAEALCKCPSPGLKNLLLNALRPQWKEGLAPCFRIVQRNDWLLVEKSIRVTDARSLEASFRPEKRRWTSCRQYCEMIGSRPGHSPLLKTPEWKEIIDAVMARWSGCRCVQRLLVNGVRPLWQEGLIPRYYIIQRKNCVIIQNRGVSSAKADNSVAHDGRIHQNLSCRNLAAWYFDNMSMRIYI